MEKLILTSLSTEELKSLIMDCLREYGLTLPIIDNSKEILTIDEACTMLGIARQTMYGKTSKNRIPFYKEGKRILFKRTELESYITNSRVRTLDELSENVSSVLKKRKKYEKVK